MCVCIYVYIYIMTSALDVFHMCIRAILVVMHGSETCVLGDFELMACKRVDSLEKTLMLGGIGGRRRRGQQRMR